MKNVRVDEVRGLIESEIIKGQMFSIIFERAAAKCPHCEKANKKWNNLDVCPICGETLSKERFTRAQLGVTNPTNTTKPGQGAFEGESGEEALDKGRLKYFDMDAIAKNGGHGDYRQCVIANIKKLRINGVDYVVVK